MERNRAEYMRAYRAAKRGETPNVSPLRDTADSGSAALVKRIAELEDEVAHLKRELAKRPSLLPEPVRASLETYGSPGFNTRPFTPVPKVKHPKTSGR